LTVIKTSPCYAQINFWVWSENFYCQFVPSHHFYSNGYSIEFVVWLGKVPHLHLIFVLKVTLLYICTYFPSDCYISFYWSSIPTRIDPHASACFPSSAGTNYCLCRLLWAVHIGTLSRWYFWGILSESVFLVHMVWILNSIETFIFHEVYNIYWLWIWIWFWQLIRNRYPSKDKRLFDDVLGNDSSPTLIFKTINCACQVSYQWLVAAVVLI
jgi:hypothetical protein